MSGAKNKTKNPVGRPRLFNSPEEFDALVDNYVELCKQSKEPVLLTGLILSLGFNSKQAFYAYKEYPEFFDSVKRASTLVEYEYEKRLNTSSQATGPIFALKNFGWSDKLEVEQKVESNNNTTVSVDPKEIKEALKQFDDEY